MYFFANFKHFTDQQQKKESNRRHGDFSMLVQADSLEEAMNLFRQKVIDFRSAGSFFSGNCTVYISELIEFTRFTKNETIMLNYQSFVGDPTLPFIACVVPDENSDACTIHHWQGNQPATEGRQDTLFLKFE